MFSVRLINKFRRIRMLLRDNRRAFSSTKASSISEERSFDVIIIGGGHAGCESAAAATRLGARTLMITHSTKTIGEMSCNPSFGGIGKGHLMREIDALDGLCARCCDQSGITFQVLNRSKGPAVLGLHAIIDRDLYKKAMQEEILEKTPGLTVLEASVDDLCLEERVSSDSSAPQYRISGCVLRDGTIIQSNTMVITTGTFLNGECFRGTVSETGGRLNEPSSTELARTFYRLGFNVGRLRTGTPPRMFKDTIDFSRFTEVPSDKNPIPFSFLNDSIWLAPEKQKPSYLSKTNQRIKELVLANLEDDHPILSEDVNGPRYCPSLEAKCMRFGHLNHRVFLEHEGLESDIIYGQGLGMSFRKEVQLEIVRCLEGLERVEIAFPGYQVHYDFVDPRQLSNSLETKKVDGLFLAGQINGTTGYEEAASQGIVAGINAALKAKQPENHKPFIIDRSQGYIGVLIDDLTSLGVKEPYRMFTSRAEHRMFLRPDNADLRLTPMGCQVGVVSEKRLQRFTQMKRRLDDLRQRLKSCRRSIAVWKTFLPELHSTSDLRILNGYEILTKFPTIPLSRIIDVWPDLFADFEGGFEADGLEDRIRNEGRYARYNQNLIKMGEKMRSEMMAELPADLDYWNIRELTLECREILDQARPPNLAAASRISGVTEITLVHLLRYAKMNLDK